MFAFSISAVGVIRPNPRSNATSIFWDMAGRLWLNYATKVFSSTVSSFPAGSSATSFLEKPPAPPCCTRSWLKSFLPQSMGSLASLRALSLVSVFL